MLLTSQNSVEMAHNWPEPGDRADDLEQRAAAALEDLETERGATDTGTATPDADTDVNAEPLENATLSDIRVADTLERVDPGVWAIDGERHRMPRALKRYAKNRASALASEASETEAEE